METGASPAMDLPTFRASLCKDGRACFGAVTETLDPNRPDWQALTAWRAFGEHAVGCPECYQPVASRGGLARLWSKIRPAPPSDPEE